MDYINKPKAERQQHLDLTTECIYGNSYNIQILRKQLAKQLCIEVPTGHRVHCCHACNDSKCINLQHVYFGTPLENRQDGKDKGFRGMTSIYLSLDVANKLKVIKEHLQAPSRSRLLSAMVQEYYDVLFPDVVSMPQDPVPGISPEGQARIKLAVQNFFDKVQAANAKEALLPPNQSTEVQVR